MYWHCAVDGLNVQQPKELSSKSSICSVSANQIVASFSIKNHYRNRELNLAISSLKSKR